jgi:hypothetical protein
MKRKLKNKIKKVQDFVLHRPFLVKGFIIIFNFIISWIRKGSIIGMISVGVQVIIALFTYQIICNIRKINVHPMMKKSEIVKHEKDRIMTMALSMIIALFIAQILACNNEVYYVLKRMYVI